MDPLSVELATAGKVAYCSHPDQGPDEAARIARALTVMHGALASKASAVQATVAAWRDEVLGGQHTDVRDAKIAEEVAAIGAHRAGRGQVAVLAHVPGQEVLVGAQRRRQHTQERGGTAGAAIGRPPPCVWP